MPRQKTRTHDGLALPFAYSSVVITIPSGVFVCRPRETGVELLKHGRFPTVWLPDPHTRDLRALVAHRVRLVRMRTMVKNGLQAIALNQRLAVGSKLWSQRGRAQLAALDLAPHTARRRGDSLELLTWLETHIAGLDARIADAAYAHPGARLL